MVGLLSTSLEETQPKIHCKNERRFTEITLTLQTLPVPFCKWYIWWPTDNTTTGLFLTYITFHDYKQQKISTFKIRGICTNLYSVESFLFEKSPDIIALCESNLNSLTSSSDFSIPGDFSLLRKDSKVQMYRLEFNAREYLPLAREPSLEISRPSNLCLRLSLSLLSLLSSYTHLQTYSYSVALMPTMLGSFNTQSLTSLSSKPLTLQWLNILG